VSASVAGCEAACKDQPLQGNKAAKNWPDQKLSAKSNHQAKKEKGAPKICVWFFLGRAFF
jgi:hypothetical protein